MSKRTKDANGVRLFPTVPIIYPPRSIIKSPFAQHFDFYLMFCRIAAHDSDGHLINKLPRRSFFEKAFGRSPLLWE